MHICRRGWWCFGGMGALRIVWKPPWTERRFAKLQEQSRVSPKGWMLTVQFDEASQVIQYAPCSRTVCPQQRGTLSEQLGCLVPFGVRHLLYTWIHVRRHVLTGGAEGPNGITCFAPVV